MRHVQRLRVAFDVQQQKVAIFCVGLLAMPVARQTVFDALFTADQQMERDVLLMHLGALRAAGVVVSVMTSIKMLSPSIG